MSRNKIVAARNGPARRHRPGQGRILCRLRCSRDSRSHPRLFFLGDGDLAVITPEGVQLTDFDGQPVEPPGPARHLGPDHGGKGRLQAFHAQGNLRAAALRARHHCWDASRRKPAKSSSTRWRSPRQSSRTSSKINIAACGTSWHAGLAGKFMIERLARIPGRSRLRQRVALSRSHHRRATRSSCYQPVRRNRRHHRRAARSQAKGREDAGHLQRGGLDDHARSRRHHLHPRRSGNRRRFHQSIYRPAHRAVLSRSVPGQVRGKLTPDAAQASSCRNSRALPDKLEHPAATTRNAKSWRANSSATGFPVPRPRHPLSHRARRRAQS